MNMVRQIDRASDRTWRLSHVEDLVSSSDFELVFEFFLVVLKMEMYDGE